MSAPGALPEAAPLEPPPDNWRRLLSEAIRVRVPIATWGRAYERADLFPDALAGLTSWGVMVPVALAYASLAGLPPEFGLVTAFAAMTAYAVFGTSRFLKVTTSSTMAVMSLAVVTPMAGGDPARFLALTAALALIVGALLVAAGLLRLGFIADFLAKTVVTGFVIGVAITIIVGQLPKILGVTATSGSVSDQLAGIIGQLPSTNPYVLAVGAGAIGLILIVRAIDKRIPGPLIAMVLGIGAVIAFDLEQHGVTIVGEIATFTPSPGLPDIQLSDLTYLLTGAAGVVFLAVGETLGAARAYAERHRQEIDGDQELVALGAANAASGFFGGFIVDASFSQTATGEAAGGRTQLSSLITAALILLTAILLAPLFRDLPNAVLGAVVITAVLGLIDIAEVRRYWAWRRSDALLAIAAMVGVVTTDVLGGLVIAVLLSLVLLLLRASRPEVAILGRMPGERDVYVDLARHPEAIPPEGVLALRLGMPLYFFNASEARSQVLAQIKEQPTPPRVVVFDIGATADLDVTAVDVLARLNDELGERGISLALAAKGGVRERLRHTGVMDRIGSDRVHMTLTEAVSLERHRIAGSGVNDVTEGPDPAPGED